MTIMKMACSHEALRNVQSMQIHKVDQTKSNSMCVVVFTWQKLISEIEASMGVTLHM